MACPEKERLTRELSEAIKELINARSIHGDTEPLSIEVLAAEQVYEVPRVAGYRIGSNLMLPASCLIF
jgi:hypothetical protein